MSVAVSTLDQMLTYEPETGKLFWLTRGVELFSGSERRSAISAMRRWNSCYAGKEALAAVCASRALHGKIFGELYYAHRVAWALHYGEWPKGDIDHVNGDRSDNRITNLRLVNHQSNMQNKAVYANSPLGAHGVSFHQTKQKFAAYITINKRRKHLGYFSDAKVALAARKAAEDASNAFHQNHGRRACLAS